MASKVMLRTVCKSMCQDLKNIQKSLEKCVFGTFRKLDFGGVLWVGSAAKVVSKRSRVTSNDKNFILFCFDKSIGAILKNI